MSFYNTKSPTRSCIDPDKVRFHLPTRGPYNKRYLTSELEQEFRRLFPIRTNREMMQLFGVGFSTLQRIKRQLGLHKNKRVIIQRQAKLCKKICEENGYYDSIRGKQPTPQCIEANRKWRAEGGHPMKSLKEKNPRRYKALLKKRSEARKELIRRERTRTKYGMEKKTNLPDYIVDFNTRRYTKKEVSRRYNARKRNYVMFPDDRYALYYDSKTQRGPRFEQIAIADGWKVLPLDE